HHLELVDEERRSDLTLRERRTVIQLRRATRRQLSRAPRLIVASSRLKSEVARFRRADDIPVVPVALDPALYPTVAVTSAPTVGVIGSMNWYPSRSAAVRVLERLWPAIVAAMPDAQLLVAGWNADRYLGHYFPLPGARLVGAVEHPEDFFGRVSVLLYPPPRGSGMKIKVLEALAYGVPVVTNAEGAEGLDVVDHTPVSIAETDEALVGETLALLSDQGLRDRLRQAGRRTVEEQFSPEPAVDRLLEAYAQVGLQA
ncbi:MAG TPA: glycosyltransferase family 4 protein, partial [Acidimicrobiales bacterium]|nr:glycosyltransferase family 4 protein [Acidimicrobiales bacterium]